LGAHKICHTAAQWVQIHDASMQMLGDMQNRQYNAQVTNGH
jgi:hypothetical protein